MDYAYFFISYCMLNDMSNIDFLHYDIVITLFIVYDQQTNNIFIEVDIIYYI